MIFTILHYSIVKWFVKKKLRSQTGNGMIEERYLKQSRWVSIGLVWITITDVLCDCKLVGCCIREYASTVLRFAGTMNLKEWYFPC
jgi:hypothetical protein